LTTKGRFQEQDGDMAIAIDEVTLTEHHQTSQRPHLYRLLRERAEHYPDAIALGAKHGLGWRTTTSRELLELVDGLAAELAGRGVEPGDRVVLWLPNALFTPVYYFALWKRGPSWCHLTVR
jgi:acyl-CoA synthetase (AMP-forming)/AMP-acid ligase II